MLQPHNMLEEVNHWAEIQAQEERDYWRARAEADELVERFDRALFDVQAAVSDLAAIFRQMAKEVKHG